MEYKQCNEDDCLEFLNGENSKYNEELIEIRKLKRVIMAKERNMVDKIESNNKLIKNMFKDFE